MLPEIILAPNAFKGSLTAFQFCEILAAELIQCDFKVHSLPLGDGGDGTAKIAAYYMNAQPITTTTVDALGRKHEATYYLKENTAIIELAEACGIKLLKHTEYDVLNCNTEGFGLLINHAKTQGARQIILCIGGSASIDGGLGALKEMGLNIQRESDVYNNYLIDIMSFKSFDLKNKFKDISFTILCDVETTLLGENGAAVVFGPQKGAKEEQISLINNELEKLNKLILHDTQVDISKLKYGGAAGGIAATFASLLGAKLISGSDFCIELSRFCELLNDNTIVITGEGKIDKQSFKGKIPGTIFTECKQNNIPVYAVTGHIDKNITEKFDCSFQMNEYAKSKSDAIKNGKEYLKIIAHDIVDYILLNNSRA